jgi:hypothetical protein
MVKMKQDRYVAREAGPDGGTVRTKVLTIDGDSLTLNADASGGSVRVRILDAEGRPLEGYGYADVTPVTSDELAVPLRWKRPLSELKGKAVRVEFELKNARLFAFSVATGKDSGLPESGGRKN